MQEFTSTFRLSLPRVVFRSALIVAVIGLAPVATADPPQITVADGFRVELVAAPPLVQHPMLGCFDDRGRLFLAESAGRNLNAEQLDELRPNSIRMLEDTDDDGVFDRSVVFADKLAIPNGALWLNGSLYVAEPPGIWRFTDTDDDGVADIREHIAGNVRSNGMSSTLHGPTLHPSGRLFWCGGQMGYTLERDKEIPDGRIAPGVFSLLPDGSEHEIYAVGGRANPVEVAFGPAGDVFGTLAILDFPDGARHDALMHWIYGGLYASRDNVPEAVNRTGPALPPLSHVGQVAPAGITRYRSTRFGQEFQNNLFWTQFNTHKLIRTTLAPEGGSFVATDHDFLVSQSVDFHPTDVIEDADGSLLVIDTGGWFRHGCPTSRIARPEALGAIYRIRRDDGDEIADPRGEHIDWNAATPESLIELLDDPRPVVVDRAISALANGGHEAFEAVRGALGTSTVPTVRLNCVWVLSRINSRASLDALIPAVDDAARDVRQAAATALGFARHRGAISKLSEIVANNDDFRVRREAAAALARIGDVKSVAPIVQALDDSADPFYQHALIDALIRIGKIDPLVDALQADSAAIRRGALLALSQLGAAEIAPDTILPMLLSPDIALREAAFQIARDDRRLQPLLSDAIGRLLADEKLIHDPDQRDAIRDTLLRVDELAFVQRRMVEAFSSPEIPVDAKAILLDVLRLSDIREFPKSWMAIVEAAVTAELPQLREQALAVIAGRQIPEFDDLLVAAVHNDRLPLDFRLGCLETVAPRLKPVPEPIFEIAIGQLSQGREPLHRMSAARAISEMAVSDRQLREVAKELTTADALVVPALLNSFARATDASTGNLLVSAIRDRENLSALPPEQLSGLIRRFPAETQAKASSLLDNLGVDLAEQERRMEELMPLTRGGDVLRGKEVFFGEKASCSACHRVKGQGELVGPNLSNIATIRTARDLLESIIFPSASIVQDYRPSVVVTTHGKIMTGLVTRRSDDEIWLKGSDLKDVRLRSSEIEAIREATVSIMPQGLEEKLSRAELRDLIAFLLDLKPSPSYLLDE